MQGKGFVNHSSLIAAGKAYLKDRRLKQALTAQVAPGQLVQAAAKGQASKGKTRCRRMGRKWSGLLKTFLVKAKANPNTQLGSGISLVSGVQLDVTKLLNGCANEGVETLKDMIEQVMTAHRLVIRHARSTIDRVQEEARRLLPDAPTGGLSRAKTREARKIFYQYAGVDARLEVSELTTCVRKLGVYGVTENLIKELFQQLDLDGDNSIDFSEFLDFWMCLNS